MRPVIPREWRIESASHEKTHEHLTQKLIVKLTLNKELIPIPTRPMGTQNRLKRSLDKAFGVAMEPEPENYSNTDTTQTTGQADKKKRVDNSGEVDNNNLVNDMDCTDAIDTMTDSAVEVLANNSPINTHVQSDVIIDLTMDTESGGEN